MSKKFNKSSSTSTNLNSRSQNWKSNKSNGKPSASKEVNSNSGSNALNDPSWYASNAQLLQDAGSLSFNTALGAVFDMTGGYKNYLKMNISNLIPAGCMAISLVPSVGLSADASSPVNIAARNIYSYVRHANAGHSNYDSPDLMMYLLAMDSLYSFYSYLIRAYGVMRLYSIKNRYLPKALIAGMGLKFNDLQENLADFRFYINSCAVKLGSMCTPSSMPYFLRHMWMYQELYTDSTSMKAQIMFYKPEFFYEYHPIDAQTGGELVPGVSWPCVDSPSAGYGLSDIMINFDKMINAVITDEDMNIMSGDILKAFGSDNVVKLAPIVEDYIVLPSYVPEVLSQMQNTTLAGSIVKTSAKISQTATGVITCNPTFYNYGYGLAGNRFLNSYAEVPTPAEVMVSTRLTTIAASETKDASSGSVASTLSSWASEIATMATAYTISPTAAAPKEFALYSSYFLNGIPVGQLYTPSITALCMFEKFAYHPSFRFVSVPSTFTLPEHCECLGEFFDLDNFTVIGVNELQKLHETALLSMFTCPQLGSATSAPIARR